MSEYLGDNAFFSEIQLGFLCKGLSLAAGTTPTAAA
jgi:hypothetical protein